MPKKHPQVFLASRQRQCSRCKPQPTQEERRAFSLSILRCAPKRDYRRILAGTVYRESVADRGSVFTSVTNVPEVFVPPLDVPAVRGLRGPGNRNVTIFGEGQKRALAGQRKRRCTVWCVPNEAFSSEFEHEQRCSIASVKI